MKIELELPPDVSIALRRFAAEADVSVERVIVHGLRDWLDGLGLLEHAPEGTEPAQ
jgi:hypothetical protein